MVRRNLARFSKVKACVDDDSGALIVADGNVNEESLLRLAEELAEKHAYIGVFLKGTAIEIAMKGNEIAKKLTEKGVEIIVCADSFKNSNIEESEIITKAFIAGEEEVLSIIGKKQVIEAS